MLKATKATAMFQTLAHKHGIVLKDNAKVVDIKNNGGEVVVFTENVEKINGKKVMVTVGSWANKLIKKIRGIDLPIQAIDSHLCYWRIKEGREDKFTIDGDFSTFASYGKIYYYGTPTLEFSGLLKLGVHGGLKCDPDRRPWGQGEMMNDLKKWIDQTFSGVIDTTNPVVKHACLYSMIPNENFVIDFLSGEFKNNVVLGVGFSGHGFKMAPLVCKILTELVTDGKTDKADLNYYRFGRFQRISKI